MKTNVWLATLIHRELLRTSKILALTPSASSLHALAIEVERIARRAGDAILEVYASSDLGVEYKADYSPLTEADQRSEEVIQAGINALAEGYLIVSEESKQLPYTERSKHHIVWVVDPLDGTKEFVKRNGEFCVCIALVEDGVPILGVIHAPVTRRSYVAWKTGGTHTVDEEGGPFVPLAQRAAIALSEARLRFCVSRSHLSEATQAYMTDFNSPQAVPMGSALKFCGIAANQIDVYPRHAPTMEWDTAAGQIILEEAGGSVVEAYSGEPLRYNKENLLNPHFIAMAPKVNA